MFEVKHATAKDVEEYPEGNCGAVLGIGEEAREDRGGPGDEEERAEWRGLTGRKEAARGFAVCACRVEL